MYWVLVFARHLFYERLSSFGDTDLNPEESRSFELGVEKGYGELTLVTTTLFYAVMDDLIQFDGNATACAVGSGCHNQMPGTTKSHGNELSVQYTVSDATNLFGNFTYTDTTMDGMRLARHDLLMGVDTQFCSHLDGGMDVRYVADGRPAPLHPRTTRSGIMCWSRGS